MVGNRAERRGSQAVEFALVLPVLVVLVAGIVDYGWYYSRELIVIGAAREGARLGASDVAGGTDACNVAAQGAKEALIQAGLPVANGSASTAWSSSAPHLRIAPSMTVVNGDDALLLQVAYPYQSLWGMVVTPTRMGASLTMRLGDQGNTTCAMGGTI